MSSDAAGLLAEAQAFDSLDRAFRWAVARTPRIVPADVVIQDEYSHDVIFKASLDCFLVFDTT
jgi:hypothetical protein